MSFNEKIKKFIPIKKFMKNIILLDSNPPLCDNAYYVYKELLRRNINNKYKIIWIVEKNKDLRKSKEKNVFFVSKEQVWKYRYYHNFSRYILDCNPFIRKLNKYQFRIYLSHGCPVKILDKLFRNSGAIDYITTTAEFWSNVRKNTYKGTNLVKNFVETGFPRDDLFFDKNQWISLFPDIEREKTILWLPTYRNHTIKRNYEQYTGIHFPLGIPCFESIEQVKQLNNFLASKKVLLVIKPHPAQDVSEIKSIDLSNLKIIYDTYFEEGTTLYNYLPALDALITDYSSVYWDFLLADKPIGLAIPDFNDYTEHVKMPYDYEHEVIGERILDYDGLVMFIENISSNKDILKYERNRNIDKYHKYRDGNSAKRVVDILEKEMNKR
ncbi:MAG: CDP-glycerol glycerophosphotransferase family protein [Clostridia bacterium]|nr:CDP-glycerol glycerophosphotransferase family protein [Clostridia bacterium]